MKVSILSSLLAPFKLIINPRALSASYRILELGTKIRGTCGWAYLETAADFKLKAPVSVDGTSFINVVNSLESGQDFEIVLQDGALAWKCGNAKGKLALAPAEAKIEPFNRRAKLSSWTPPKDFATALDLGSLSGGTNALATVGLFGVILNNKNDNLKIQASDDVSFSSCVVEGAKIPDAPDMMTISPESAQLLALMFARFKGGVLEFDEKSIYYKDEYSKLLVQQVPPLQRDLEATINSLSAADVVVKLPTERITAFVKRATALAEAKRHTYVDFSAEKGRLLLSFEEGISTADEHYPIADLDVPDLPFVRLDASKMARALSHTTHIVLDHIENKVVVFKGDKPDFRYGIAGKSAE